MRILLIGATGMIGSRIAAEALGRGHQVTKATRSGADGAIVLNAADAKAVAVAAAGHDAVIMAVKADPDGVDVTAALVEMGAAVADGMAQAGVKRLVIVGGAGSLEVAPGVLLISYLGDAPEVVKAQAYAQMALLDHFKAKASGLDWTYISPGGMIEPGERTGVFRVGSDKQMTDAEGKSRISAEDYAVGLVDALERGAHIGQHISFGY